MCPQVKDYKKRKLYCHYELQRLELQALIQDDSVGKEIKAKCVRQLNALPRNSSKVRLRNRCLATGRGRGVYRFCRLSRIKLRELGSTGRITGLRKSSW